VLFVKMNDDLCVGTRMETVAFGFELMTQINEVVNFAVVGDPDGAVFVRRFLVTHGHVAIGREIENSEPAAAEADVGAIGETALPEPGVVGAAMGLHARHASQGIRIAAIYETTDAAHGL